MSITNLNNITTGVYIHKDDSKKPEYHNIVYKNNSINPGRRIGKTTTKNNNKDTTTGVAYATSLELRKKYGE